MKTLISWVFNILQPSCWVRNHPACKYWDAELNAQLDNPTFTDFGKHTVKLNGSLIWVANYPYAYGTARHSAEDALPFRSTVRRLRRLHTEAYAKYVFDSGQEDRDE
jgi:hypothetical protein